MSEYFTSEQMRDLLTDTKDAVEALEEKVDKMLDGTTPANVQLTGSKMELYGASLDDRPDATTVPIGATFTIVDASQEFRSWMSNGTNWGEEI